jgi:hypothetical protein
MALKERVLKVTLSMPGGDIVLDAELKLNVRIRKAALAIQSRATVDIVGLSKTLREQLLSQFTAWNRRQVATGQTAQNYIDVKIEAGYITNGIDNSSIVFTGQVVLAELTSPPPNIGIRITCFTRQIDKTSFISSPAPSQTTFFKYVEWAAGQMGFGTSFICETSYNDVTIYNAARSILTSSALLLDIQNMYRPDVAAFVDDDVLIVKDRNKIINPGDIAEINEFIGIPCWTEWGVEFTAMFTGSVRLAQGAKLTSIMNPSLSGVYVITEIDYDLTSRDRAFYVKASGSPPA